MPLSIVTMKLAIIQIAQAQPRPTIVSAIARNRGLIAPFRPSSLSPALASGRGVSGDEALAFGLANRLTEPGTALDGAVTVAQELARLPQLCLRSDRRSSYEQWALSLDDALSNEFERGAATIASGETLEGAARFASGAGRHGEPAS